MRVIRTDTGHVRVDGKWFSMRSLREALWQTLEDAGSTNVAFDIPGAFYSGSPWGDVLLSLGVVEVAEPANWRAEYVPPLGVVWRAHRPLWEALWPEMVETLT
jgi:hypothetical protein